MPDYELIKIIYDKILDQAHSSVERAGLLGGVRFRQLEIDEKYKLHGDTLAEAIQKDKQQGLIPFYVSLYAIHPLLLLVSSMFHPAELSIQRLVQ